MLFRSVCPATTPRKYLRSGIWNAGVLGRSRPEAAETRGFGLSKFDRSSSFHPTKFNWQVGSLVRNVVSVPPLLHHSTHRLYVTDASLPLGLARQTASHRHRATASQTQVALLKNPPTQQKVKDGVEIHMQPLKPHLPALGRFPIVTAYPHAGE